MDKQLSAHQFKSVYEDLGYDIGKLGCIMLDIDPEDLEKRVNSLLTPDQVYVAPDASDHTNGVVAATPHVTLLYGLLRSGPEMKKHVLQVLDGGQACPATVRIDGVGYFESHDATEPYYSIVAHLVITPELLECNNRLKFLPHIDIFTDYQAHMTLAYIKADETVRDRVVKSLNMTLSGRVLPTKGLNFGD